MSGEPVSLSLVVPVYNEARSVPELYSRIISVVETQLKSRFEIIFVDDGSSDNSFAECEKLFRAYPEVVRVIRLRANLGKSTALSVGIKLARFPVITTLDADLQDDPAEIPRFLEKISEGFDVVSGWRLARKDVWHKRILSLAFNRGLSIATGTRLRDVNCGLKAFRKDALDHLHLYGGMHRYILLLAKAKGFLVTEIPVTHLPRRYGHSKYGPRRTYRAVFDAITVILLTRYVQSPLHFFGLVGTALGFVGSLIMVYLMVEWSAGEPIGQRPALIAGVLFLLAGLQLFSVGLIGELFVGITRPEANIPIRTKLDSVENSLESHGAVQ